MRGPSVFALNCYQTLYSITPSKFDTDTFVLPCGKVELQSDCIHTPEIGKEILFEAQKQMFQHLTVKIPSHWTVSQNCLEACGFRFKVCSLFMERTAGGKSPSPCSIERYDGSDDERIIQITEESFTKNTRFHFEALFSTQDVSRLYRQWASNLVQDRSTQILVHREKGIITAYVSIDYDHSSRRGHLELLAVAPDHHGKKIGNLLLGALPDQFPDAHFFSAMTESINFPALRMYQKAGFYIKQSWTIFHWSKKKSTETT